MTTEADSQRAFLRHTLATLAYRGGKVLRNAPPGFGTFRAGDTTRRPDQLLAHIADLLDWTLDLASGTKRARDSEPGSWEGEAARFYAGLEALDTFLASGEPLQQPVEKLFQGPIADAHTHVGQLAMMRRMAGSPVRGENYFVADIVTGRVGREQSAPRREFD